MTYIEYWYNELLVLTNSFVSLLIALQICAWNEYLGFMRLCFCQMWVITMFDHIALAAIGMVQVGMVFHEKITECFPLSRKWEKVKLVLGGTCLPCSCCACLHFGFSAIYRAVEPTNLTLYVVLCVWACITVVMSASSFACNSESLCAHIQTTSRGHHRMFLHNFSCSSILRVPLYPVL